MNQDALKQQVAQAAVDYIDHHLTTQSVIAWEQVQPPTTLLTPWH